MCVGSIKETKNGESACISSHFWPIKEKFCVNDPHMFEPSAQKVSTITLTECEKQLQSILLFLSYAVESCPGSVSADLYDVIVKLTFWIWNDITSLYPVIVEFQNLHTNSCIMAKNTFCEVDLKPPNSTQFILKKFLPGMPEILCPQGRGETDLHTTQKHIACSHGCCSRGSIKI